jgi:hypothetical protein
MVFVQIAFVTILGPFHLRELWDLTAMAFEDQFWHRDSAIKRPNVLPRIFADAEFWTCALRIDRCFALDI